VGDGARRRLIVVPVRDYPDADCDFRTGIDEQVRVVHGWWADRGRLGERAFTPSAPVTVLNRDHVTDFLRDEGVYSASKDDVLVVYVCGHGRRGRDGGHFLLLPDGDPGNYLRDGLPTADLVARIAASDATHVLVIVNACFAGTLEADLRRLLANLQPTRRDLDTVAVVVSADFDERPRVREFSGLLSKVAQALRTTAGFTAPELTVEEFVAELTRAARDERVPRPIKVWPRHYSLTTTACLPNPGYQPPTDVVSPARRQVAARAEELDYWLARASGRRDEKDGGWYFSGRRGLTDAVNGFLAGTGHTLVVTGTVGSGKSAVIARAVTLGDPDFLASPRYTEAVAEAQEAGTLPPPGSVDIAVLARNKETHQLLGDLIQGLGGTSSETVSGADRVTTLRRQFQELAGRRPRPPTVVLDGLDEAVDPTRVVSDVIGPLSLARNERAGVRWLIGVRSPVPGLGEVGLGLLGLVRRALDVADEAVVRTDGPEITDDLAAYVEALLRGSSGWYGSVGGETGDSSGALVAQRRAELARLIAERVHPSFLDARFAAARLDAASAPQAPDDAMWLASLDEGTVGQLRHDAAEVARTAQFEVAEVVAVLRASAFALGAGVPWADVWPAMARGVLGRPIPRVDAVIEQVTTGRLEGYLVRTEEDGRVVYAPVHQRLAEVLRDEAERLVEHGV
jgi:hypothetical protein